MPSSAFGTVAVTLPVFSSIDTFQTLPLSSVYVGESIVYLPGLLLYLSSVFRITSEESSSPDLPAFAL